MKVTKLTVYNLFKGMEPIVVNEETREMKKSDLAEALENIHDMNLNYKICILFDKLTPIVKAIEDCRMKLIKKYEEEIEEKYIVDGKEQTRKIKKISEAKTPAINQEFFADLLQEEIDVGFDPITISESEQKQREKNGGKPLAMKMQAMLLLKDFIKFVP